MFCFISSFPPLHSFLVRVKADKRIYVVNGPNRAEGAGFTLDIVNAAPAGAGVFKSWLFMSQRGVDLLSRTKQTVTLQSLTASSKGLITIGVNDWLGSGPFYWCVWLCSVYLTLLLLLYYY